MNPWLETAGVALIAGLGVALGGVSGRLRRPCWALGYVASLSLIALLVLGRCYPSLHFTRPYCWIVATRARFLITALAITLGLSTPLSRLPRQWERAGMWLLMTGLVVRFSVLPFLLPALLGGRLAGLQTTIDGNGVCLQTTAYTCGPAAAVTALRRLGLPADEGELAVLAHTNPVVGTLPACLDKALRNRYASDGLACQYRRFDSLAELDSSDITLAIIHDAFLLDHCVAVLAVTHDTVTLADPYIGIRSMPCEQFENVWRSTGIALSRDADPAHLELNL